jgi:hypothetical protein
MRWLWGLLALLFVLLPVEAGATCSIPVSDTGAQMIADINTCLASAGGGTPGGAANSVQYNNASAFGGITLSGDTVLQGNTGAAPGALTLPNCLDSGGNHLNYSTSTHLMSCGTSGGGGSGTIQSGTGPAIAQYPGGTGTTVGPATVSGDATIAQGGAMNILGLHFGAANGVTLPSSAPTSGGVPYFSSASAMTSSAALTLNLPVIGGGAGGAPAVGTRSGNTISFATTSGALSSGDCAKFDASGNVIDNGATCGGAGTVLTAPQGRLTLTSATPVMTADATAQATVFYDSFVGSQVPISGSMITIPSNEASLVLDATHDLSGSLYDVFAINSSGLVLCSGPAWTSTSARGTGAGTTELQLSNGVWTNKNSLTNCWNNSVDKGPISANQGTYLGTFKATANGQTGMQFTPAAAAGGSNSILGLYNAYNQRPLLSTSRDNTATWTYTTATWRAANNNNNNRISFVDGLGQSYIDSAYTVLISNNAIAQSGVVGIDLNSTTATPFISNLTFGVSVTAFVPGRFDPVLGLQFVQAMEYSTGSTTTFQGTANSAVNQVQMLSLRIDM